MFDMRGNVSRIGQRLRHTAAFDDGDEIEQGILGMTVQMGELHRGN